MGYNGVSTLKGKEAKKTQKLPPSQINQRLRKLAARGKHICESKNRRQELTVKTYTVHLRHQKKPKEHENYRLSWSTGQLLPCERTQTKKSKRPAVWSDRKVTHRPISKLKNYKMQKASSLKRTTSHCWIFSFFIPVISRISKSDCTLVLSINFKAKIECYVIVFEGFERILIIGNVLI